MLLLYIFANIYKKHCFAVSFSQLINQSGPYLVGGELEVLDRIKWNDGLDDYRLTPNELRKKFTQLQADAVFAFQVCWRINY